MSAFLPYNCPTNALLPWSCPTNAPSWISWRLLLDLDLWKIWPFRMSCATWRHIYWMNSPKVVRSPISTSLSSTQGTLFRGCELLRLFSFLLQIWENSLTDLVSKAWIAELNCHVWNSSWLFRVLAVEDCDNASQCFSSILLLFFG